MVPERVTVTVESEFGADGPLTVGEALRQVIELFDLFIFAQGEDAKSVNWRLISISKSSPLEAVAEPFGAIPGMDVETIARSAARAVHKAFVDITTDVGVPGWMDSNARQTIRTMLERNTSTIGRTSIKFDDADLSTVMLVPKRANAGLATLQRAEAEIASAEPDFSRSEIGSIQGRVTDATTYRKQPALRIRERRSGNEVLCVFTEETAERAGKHSWSKVWEGARVRIYGRIQYDKKGVPSSVAVDDIIEIAPPNMSFADFYDPNFTAGIPISDFLSEGSDIG